MKISRKNSKFFQIVYTLLSWISMNADRENDGMNFTICDLFWDFFRAIWNAPKKQYEKTVKPRSLSYRYFLYWLLLIAILLTGSLLAKLIAFAIMFLIWVLFFFAIGILYIVPVLYFRMYLEDREYEKPKLFTAIIRFVAWIFLCFYIVIPIIILFPYAPEKGSLEIMSAILIPCAVIGLIGGLVQFISLIQVAFQLVGAIYSSVKKYKETNVVSPIGFIYSIFVSLKNKLCIKIEFVD